MSTQFRTADRSAIEQIVRGWMKTNHPNIPCSFAEDSGHLGVVVRIHVPSDIRQKLFEAANRSEIIAWLAEQF
jgi:hypothetical protein